MGCNNCGDKNVMKVKNSFNFEALTGLYENTNNVVISNPSVVLYKGGFYIQLTVEYDFLNDETEEIERKTETLTVATLH